MAPCALLVVLALALAQASAIAFPRLDGTPDPFEPMPVNLTIAFIGDQGPSDTPDWDFPDKIMRPNAVLQLVRNESAHAVLHQGGKHRFSARLVHLRSRSNLRRRGKGAGPRV
jgi:hypothetical protein